MTDEQAEEKVEEISQEEKIEKVRAVDALRNAGYSVTDACRIVGVPKSTYYKWKQEVDGQEGGENESEPSQLSGPPKDIQDAYEIIKKYESKPTTAQASENPLAQVTQQIVAAQKELSKLRSLLATEGGSMDSGALEEIKQAIAYLAKEIEELKSKQQVYMGRVKKVRHPDGTEIEYDLMPRDSVLIKQAETMYDRVIPEIVQEMKGMRSDFTMFASRLLGLIEANIAQEMKKAPGFFPLFKRRTKEERERELEELNKMLEEKEREIMRINVNEVVGNEVPAGNVGERRSGENNSSNEPGSQAS